MERFESLAEALPKEQQRVREILPFFDEIPTGVFAATMMRMALSRAERAASSGDVVAMLFSYEELKRYSR